MKTITTLFAIVLSIPLFAQNTLQIRPATFSKLLVGISISPDYCFRTLENNDGSSTSAMIIDLRNNKEQFKIGYTAGLNICYNISNRWSIESGVLLSSKGYAIMIQDTVTFMNQVDQMVRSPK
jgi:hypothetical protein